VPILVLAAVFLAGCGSAGEVESGAVVHVYVSAPLCAEAKQELAKQGPVAGGVKVQALCLPSAESKGGGVDLSRAGATARRATEDSSAVAFVSAPGREGTFTEPILEKAEIALIAERSGAAATAEVLKRLDARGSDESPREAVWAG
jgi:hypothetical protein